MVLMVEPVVVGVVVLGMGVVVTGGVEGQWRGVGVAGGWSVHSGRCQEV